MYHELGKTIANNLLNPSHPASFSGARKLKIVLEENGNDISTYKIQKWLQRQEPLLRPLENSQGLPVEKALDDILRDDCIPNKIRTDKGQEFLSKCVESLLTIYYIKHLFVQNTEIKVHYADRVIKTIKTKM